MPSRSVKRQISTQKLNAKWRQPPKISAMDTYSRVTLDAWRYARPQTFCWTMAWCLCIAANLLRGYAATDCMVGGINSP